MEFMVAGRIHHWNLLLERLLQLLLVGVYWDLSFFGSLLEQILQADWTLEFFVCVVTLDFAAVVVVVGLETFWDEEAWA